MTNDFDFRTAFYENERSQELAGKTSLLGERSKYIASIREVLYFAGLEQILASSLQMEISLDEIANQIVNDEEIARSIKALARLLNIIEQKRTYRYLNTVRLRKETR